MLHATLGRLLKTRSGRAEGLRERQVTGGRDVLALRADAKLDGSEPIAGGIPLCFPQSRAAPGVLESIL